MADFTDANKMAAHIKARAERKQQALSAATEATADFALKTAQRYTSGSIRQAQLTAAGHPFARNHRPQGHNPRVGLSGAFPLLYINRQSDRLYKSWRKRRVGAKGDVAWQVLNTATEARFALAPGGTKNVVDRGFWKAVNEQVRQYARPRTGDAFTKG